MKRRFILPTIISLIIIGCTSENSNSLLQNPNSNKINQEFILKFSPSFHKELIVNLKIISQDSVKLLLYQDQYVLVFDTLVKLSEDTYDFRSFGDYSEALDLVKPNFMFEYYLSREEANSIIKEFHVIDRENANGSDYGIDGEDGIIIYYEHQFNGEKSVGEFWSPPMNSVIGKSCISILEYLEESPYSIIERTAELIKQYISNDAWNFKTISIDPLYVRVLDKPCCPCGEMVNGFIEDLPERDIIYLDITNYGFYKRNQEDLSCIEDEFRKKYSHIRWIYNGNEWDRFRDNFYKE